jgi:hypothetical protein
MIALARLLYSATFGACAGFLWVWALSYPDPPDDRTWREGVGLGGIVALSLWAHLLWEHLLHEEDDDRRDPPYAGTAAPPPRPPRRGQAALLGSMARAWFAASSRHVEEEMTRREEASLGRRVSRCRAEVTGIWRYRRCWDDR